jgi:hypothetical protein
MSTLVIPDDWIAVHKMLGYPIPDSQIGSERVDENQGDRFPGAFNRVVDCDTVPIRKIHKFLP